MHRFRALAPLLGLALAAGPLLAGCGGDDGDAALEEGASASPSGGTVLSLPSGSPSSFPSPTEAAPPAAPEEVDRLSGTRVTMAVDPGDGSEPALVAALCDPPGGDVPDPAAACDLLAEVGAEGLTAREEGEQCAQVVAGPETATLEGVVDGEVVKTEFSRSDACATARWDRFAVLLPVPGGP